MRKPIIRLTIEIKDNGEDVQDLRSELCQLFPHAEMRGVHKTYKVIK